MEMLRPMYPRSIFQALIGGNLCVLMFGFDKVGLCFVQLDVGE